MPTKPLSRKVKEVSPKPNAIAVSRIKCYCGHVIKNGEKFYLQKIPKHSAHGIVCFECLAHWNG